jgi:hypothetical protein
VAPNELVIPTTARQVDERKAKQAEEFSGEPHPWADSYPEGLLQVHCTLLGKEPPVLKRDAGGIKGITYLCPP